MSRKSKGINAERELVHKFWDSNWACIRVAGSGSSKYPSPDLLVGNNIRKLAIECKITKEQSKHFSEDEIKSLDFFSKTFGAESWVAIKFQKHGWFFINLEDLKETKSSNYSINLGTAKLKGLNFEELTEMAIF